ncbi:aminotransferase class V-fold PLP-dependent enzyme [Brumicola nitratireducens]|uniref:Aminotransferase, class V n=1 Tax=Glaciecola nitratireducens (strain JCM 12485 / KCTC 12276 / FR1064) TaxID=1085623 RepID=G4QE59_GLANF|nr:aminotransferase class V-fold PLP-dependent enzyme [Glaciecola nitratireducens]AEP31333.1 aminotransferase, class V [Glaciecola nitratireducens FR1064]
MNTKQYASYFHLPDGIYALAHSVGPLPKVSKLALQEHYLAPWEALGGDAWPKWLQSVDDFCTSVASLINASADEICPQPNLASGFSAYLSALAKLPKNKSKQRVLMHQDAFASMGFVVTGLAQAYGLELVLIQGDPNSLDAWDKELAKGNVLACLFTHVHSNTSIKSDLVLLVELAKSHSAYALVDIAQSVGVVPVDSKEWGADAIFGSCVKWLCGGPGAGFMFIKASHINELEPDPIGWFSHQNPFEFDINHYAPANNAKRFWGGTPSVAPYVSACASINMILEIGVENIAKHNTDLKRRLLNSLPNYVTIKPNEAELSGQGGSLCIGCDDMEKAAEKLNEAGVRYDRRGDIFRLSLHIMNNFDDADVIARCFI